MTFSLWLSFCAISLIALIAFSTRPLAFPKGRDYFILFFSLALLALNFFQQSLKTGQFWTDEFQLIVQARQLIAGGVCWVDFDPLSSGPLNVLVLALPYLVFGKVDVGTARVIALLCYEGQFIFGYLICSKLYGKALSRILILPLILLISSVQKIYFNSYNSGALPGLLISLIFYLMVSSRDQKDRYWKPFVIGLSVAALVFCKIQLAITSAFFFTFYLLKNIRDKNLANPALFAAGACTLCVSILLPTFLHRGIKDFFMSYILGASAYNKELISYSGPIQSLDWDPVLTSFLAGGIFTILVGLVVSSVHGKGKIWEHSEKKALALSVGLLLAQQAEAAIPRTGFPHYYVQMCFGLWIFLIMLFVHFYRKTYRSTLLGAMIVWITFILYPRVTLSNLRSLKPFFENQASESHWFNRHLPKKLPQGASLSIWGYAPQIYYHLELLPATRDVATMYAMAPHSYQSYFQKRYVADLRNSKPDFIVDFTDSGKYSYLLNDWIKFGYQTNPYLRELIDHEYKLVTVFKEADVTRGALLFQRTDSSYAWPPENI